MCERKGRGVDGRGSVGKGRRNGMVWGGGRGKWEKWLKRKRGGGKDLNCFRTDCRPAGCTRVVGRLLQMDILPMLASLTALAGFETPLPSPTPTIGKLSKRFLSEIQMANAA
jgi:hypothetical protein